MNDDSVVEEDDPRAVIAALISNLPATAVAEVAVDWDARQHLNGDDPTAEDRLVAVRQLLWQDPIAGLDALLAQVADVDIEGEDRIAVIRLAVSVGPAARLATVWLLDRIDYAHLEPPIRVEAMEIHGSPRPYASWWVDAFALVARNPHLDIEHRAEAAASLVGRSPGRAAYLALPAWLPMHQLPSVLYEERERGSEWAYHLLQLIATDAERPAEERVDAAEWLTMDPDKSESVGEEVLLDVLEDDRVDPLVRSRAWIWLEGNDEAWEALEELPGQPARATRSPSVRPPRISVDEYLARYRAVLGGAVDAYKARRVS